MNTSETVGLTLIVGVMLTIIGMYGYEGVSSTGTRFTTNPNYWQKICIATAVSGIMLILGGVLFGKYLFDIPQLR